MCDFSIPFSVHSENIITNLEDMRKVTIAGYNINNIEYPDDAILIEKN